MIRLVTKENDIFPRNTSKIYPIYFSTTFKEGGKYAEGEFLHFKLSPRESKGYLEEETTLFQGVIKNSFIEIF